MSNANSRGKQNDVYTFSRQLCELLQLTLKSKDAAETLGHESYKELNARIREIDSLLTNICKDGFEEDHLTQQYNKEGESPTPTTRGSQQHIIALTTQLQSLMEWLVMTPSSFYLLLHLHVMTSAGGSSDQFFVLLKSLFTLSASSNLETEARATTADEESNNQQTRDGQHQPHRSLSTRATNLKRLLTEWRRLSRGGKRKCRSALMERHQSRAMRSNIDRTNNQKSMQCVVTKNGADNDVGVNEANAGTQQQQQDSSSIDSAVVWKEHHEGSAMISEIGTGGDRTFGTSIQTDTLDMATDAEVEISVDALLTSVNLLFHLFCLSLFPVILWSYLTRCVYPSTVDRQDNCNHQLQMAGDDHVPNSNTNQVPSSKSNQVPSSKTNQVPNTNTNHVPNSNTNQVPNSNPSFFVDDDILGLQSIITTALSLYSSLLSVDCRSVIPILRDCGGSLSICLPPTTTVNENVPKHHKNVPNHHIHRDATRAPHQSGESALIDFDLIMNAKTDHRVLEASKDKESNPYLESAVAAVTTQLLIPRRCRQDDARYLAPDNNNNQQRRHYRQPGHDSSTSQLLADCRQSNVSGSFFSVIQWTDRLRPYLVLQTLRLIRLELLSLLPWIRELQSTDGLMSQSTDSLMSQLTSQFPQQKATPPQKQQPPSQQQNHFPGILLCFSCLHQFIASLISFNFHPVESLFESTPLTANSLSRHSLHPDSYRFPVDEEFMMESFKILTGLQSHFSSFDCPKSLPSIPPMPSKQFQSIFESLSQSSFQRSLDLCLLRSEYEILPRAVLMILSFKNVIKKTKS